VLSLAVIFVARCLLVMLFLPFSTLDKILNPGQAVAQAAQGVRAPWLARTLIFAGAAVEVVMSLAILTGVADRLAAFVLAGYCLVTALVWKQFWKTADFRLRGVSQGREVFWDFLKNVALAGGFLMLTFGSDAAGVGRFVDRPFASSHPYAVIEEGAR